MAKTRQRACAPLSDDQLEQIHTGLDHFFQGMSEVPDPQDEHSEDWIDGYLAAIANAKAVIPMWLNDAWP